MKEEVELLSKEESVLLGKLLEKMSKDPRGFIPEEVWLPIHSAVSMPYIEMVIIRRSPKENKVEILLTHRTDENWNGWHIPGGLWRTPDSVEDAITKLAKAELKSFTGLVVLAKGTWEKQIGHPRGFPLSHIVICEIKEFLETENKKFFSEIPKDMIDDNGYHIKFIKSVFKQVKEQNLLPE